MVPRRIRLRCGYALGDIVALTGAVRELHEQHPGEFETDVETTAEEVWWHNPYITRIHAPAQVIDCNAVCIDRTGRSGKHYIAAYLDLLNARLGVNARLQRVAGDIYLSDQEKDWYSDVWTLCKDEIPFWIVCAGGKFDLPVKWWSVERYQEVIDYFKGRIQFVQVGSWGNYHPKLRGTIDLRGKTSIRDLIHLMHYAQGVFCGVTSIMHLAAAVPSETGMPRAAVIVAGGREPETWEKYPHHRFLSTAKDLSCAHCWKHRHLSLPDRARNDTPAIRCHNVKHDLPLCMDMIPASVVIEQIEAALRAGEAVPLNEPQRRSAEVAVLRSEKESTFDKHNVHPLNAVAQAEQFLTGVARYKAGRFRGRGIVLCGGGVSYFTNAWVCVKMLRKHGCDLPIELWYLGRAELDHQMESLISPLGVKCINAREVMNRYPLRNPLGWELKSYALLHCSFKDVLLLDADNVPVRNPEFLFETPEFLGTGAIFWPDYRRLSPRRAIWKVCGVAYRDEPEFESGQMVIDKERCWRALNLAFWYNDHSEFFYQYIHGDKDTFHLAWRKVELEYSMPPYAIHPLEATMCQHDFHGNRLFQHRNLAKWTLFGENPRIEGFLFEEDCRRFLDELRQRWDGTIRKRREIFAKHGFSFRKGTFDENIFASVALLNEYGLPDRFDAKDVIVDVGAHIGSFAAACYARGSRQIICFEANDENASLARQNLRVFAGVKVVNRAVLDRRAQVRMDPFPSDHTGQNTGGSSVFLDEKGSIRAITLDSVLRQCGRVRLLKLDCEGSEWPILHGSRELHRVQEVCGEFHQLDRHPHLPDIGRLDRDLLRRLLRRNFPVVRTQIDRRNPRLGKFWASRGKVADALEP